MGRQVERGERVRLPRLTRAEGFTVHPFDEENGVRTSGLIPGRFLKSGHRHDRGSTAYFGVAPSVFHGLLKRWLRTRPCAPLEEFSFVDIGAGMGRGVLLAAGYPFSRIEGIELNAALARIAQRNVRLWKAAGKAHGAMRVTCGDAVEFRFPKGPCLVFLFNPFGAAVMRRMLARLAVVFAGR